MKSNSIPFLVIFFCSFCPKISTAQIRDIKKQVETDKSNSRTSKRSGSSYSYSYSSSYDYDEESSDGSSLISAVEGVFFIFEGLGWIIQQSVEGVVNGQASVITGLDTFPDRRGIEMRVSAGYDPKRYSSLYTPSVRMGNGIFATDLRFVQLEDVTGRLQSFDWQMLMIRIPIKGFKLEYGVGFTHLYDPDKSYFESSLGFDWRFLNQRANIKSQYRWTPRTSLGSRYRQEYNISVDYLLKDLGHLKLSPSLGITHQNYFDNIGVTLFQVGIVARFR